MTENEKDIARQCRMMCEYRQWLQRMYGRTVSEGEAARMWARSEAIKYRLLHPYLNN